MTQTIEQLTARIAELEADLAAARQIIDEENKDHIEQLATSQLSNQQLREALEKTRGALAYVKGNGRDNPNLMESTAWHGLGAADKALTQPTSTEALDAYVAEKVKEATLPVADELQAGRLQWMVRETAAEEKVTTLTRQRDLAVEWLERCAVHVRPTATIFYEEIMEALSTIKGSEK